MDFELTEKNMDSYVDVVAVVVVSVVADVDVLETRRTTSRQAEGRMKITDELVDVVVGSPGQ